MSTSARHRRVQLVLAVVLLFVLLLGAAPAPGADNAPSGCDPLTSRALTELARFTSWLRANNAQGYIGEVGWPEEWSGDGAKWNMLAERWYRDADVADLWVTAWATGEWWGTTYPLAAYQDRTAQPGVDTARSQGEVIERHRSIPGRPRGVNVAGAEFGAPNVAPTSGFSNANRGTYDRDYHYDGQATFDFLAGRGVKLVRIPFRWERIAPRLGAPLSQAEVQRLKAAVARAGRAGLRVVLDMHNYGGYYLGDGHQGVRRTLGSAQLPQSVFGDVWRRLSIHFRRNTAVVGYGLMNEPAEMTSVGSTPPAILWERASQAAVAAIRANGDRKWVMVSAYPWGSVWSFGSSHPRAWIRDPVNRIRYEAHQYFDYDNSGTYQYGYAEQTTPL
jgi:Cellulase (glycosyl hydrolase family 5)